MYLVTIALVLLPSLVLSAKILAIIPTASFSHQAPFRPLWKELSLRGHELVVATTDPMNDTSLTNIREIDMHEIYEIYERHGIGDVMINESKTVDEIRQALSAVLVEATQRELALPEIQELINDKELHFDLLITEAQYVTMTAFSWRFKCPWIGVASMDAPMHMHQAVGNPTHPFLYPDPNLDLDSSVGLGFRDRLISLAYYLFYNTFIYYIYYPREHKRLVEVFGDDLPPLADIQNNMSMLFANAHPAMYQIRPVYPTTVLIGDGIHIAEPKPLPKDLEKFLNSSAEGVIYFSLGTNVRSRALNDTTKKAIVEAFSELPYDVLWKFDNVTGLTIPPNVRVEKWVPQQDVLRHPNIKLFITQAGLQSLQEALVNHVPMVCIPFFGDQLQNAQRMKEKGVAVRLPKSEITKENFKSAILEVINKRSYKKKARNLGNIMKDNPMSGLEKAVWWTEYVLRHKGAGHLRGTANSLPFYQYFCLDVIGFLFVIIWLSDFLMVKAIKFITYIVNKKANKAKKH